MRVGAMRGAEIHAAGRRAPKHAHLHARDRFTPEGAPLAQSAPHQHQDQEAQNKHNDS